MKRAGILFVLSGLVFLSSANGSGSVGGGGSADAYSRGRAVVGSSLACDSCLFPGGIHSPEQAVEALKKIKSGAVSLTEDQTQAVFAYLVRRFKIEVTGVALNGIPAIGAVQ